MKREVLIESQKISNLAFLGLQKSSKNGVGLSKSHKITEARRIWLYPNQASL